MINSTLLLKTGAAPFHFWFPGVIEGLTWGNSLILITWQKIAPIILVSYNVIFKFFIWIIVLSIIIGALGGLNQTSLRKLIAFSSISHLGWIIAAIISQETLWKLYFCIYTLLRFSVIFIFNTFKLSHINQIFSFQLDSSINKIILFITLLSLGGLPPFLGFAPKWIVIQFLTAHSLFMLVLIIVTFTLITLYFYLRICFAAFIINYWHPKWNNNYVYTNEWNSKIILILTFISSFGLLVINLIFIS